jgi:flavin reductase
MPVAPDDFRLALSRFATGVTVMTTCADDAAHAMTANAFTSVSLDPPLVLVCVDLEAAMHPLVLRSGVFAVSMLNEEQEPLSTWFSTPTRPLGSEQFDGVAWRPAPVTGCPLLDGAVAHVDCRLRDAHEAGDHSIVVGEVVAAGVDPQARPLLYYASAYRRLP